VNRARLLRKKATDTERILWRHLRNRNFAGYKFRRQHPLDSYVLDFYCPTAKLAIELDGGGHNYHVGQIRDRTRSEFLGVMGSLCCGFGIIRFARNSTASCKPSGLRCRSGARRNPHHNPLPVVKARRVHAHPRKYDVISREGAHAWLWQRHRRKVSPHFSRLAPQRGYGEGKERKGFPASPRSRGED
jgi:very-short-patch-repair endonuclease